MRDCRISNWHNFYFALSSKVVVFVRVFFDCGLLLFGFPSVTINRYQKKQKRTKCCRNRLTNFLSLLRHWYKTVQWISRILYSKDVIICLFTRWQDAYVRTVQYTRNRNDMIVYFTPANIYCIKISFCFVPLVEQMVFLFFGLAIRCYFLLVRTNIKCMSVSRECFFVVNAIALHQMFSVRRKCDRWEYKKIYFCFLCE